MASRSLYAYQNSTGTQGGTIGSTYRGNGIINVTTIAGGNNQEYVTSIGNFTSLPIGIYSVFVSAPLTIPTASASVCERWVIGASTIGPLDDNFGKGSNAIINFPTTMAAEVASPTLVTNFILNYTNPNETTLYINSLFTNGSIENNNLRFNCTSTTSATLIATKIA